MPYKKSMKKQDSAAADRRGTKPMAPQRKSTAKVERRTNKEGQRSTLIKSPKRAGARVVRRDSAGQTRVGQVLTAKLKGSAMRKATPQEVSAMRARAGAPKKSVKEQERKKYSGMRVVKRGR